MNTVLAGFSLGIWLCQQQAALTPWSVWSATAVLCALAARRVARRWPKAAPLVLLLTGLLAGFSYANYRAAIRLDDRLVEVLEGRDVTIAGVVRDLPQHSARGVRFQFDTLDAPAGVPSRASLWWYATDAVSPPTLHAGESWRLTVRLRQPHGTMNPHGFDHEAWLFERGIGAVGYVRAKSDNRRLESRAAGLWPWVDALRESVRNRFERALPDSPWRGVLVALAVGDQASISRAQWTLFRRTGVTHLMSISGLHVTLIGALVSLVVGALWRRSERLTLRLPARKAALLGGALAAGFYVLLAGCGVPAQRTFYMLAVAALALWLGRAGEVLRTLLLALAVVLVIDPWAVLAAGFWLSFGAVGALLLVSASGGMKSWLGSWVRTQWAVTILTLPMLLGLFQEFSLISPFTNAVAIPMVSALIVPLALLYSVFHLPSLAELADWLVAWLMRFLEWFATAPAAVWQQAAPPGWLVAMGVVAALWSLLPPGVPGRRTSLLVMVPLLAWTPERPLPGAMTVTVLDVGQGLAVHVRTARHDLLYDAGPRYTTEADSGERVVVPFLRASGVVRLDALVISHDDNDHSGGVDSVLAVVPTRVLASSLPVQHPLRQVGLPHVPCRRGLAWEWDGVRFQILHPAQDDLAAKDNDRSCVLRLISKHGSLLLPGDIEARAEQAMLQADRSALRADVLIAPHHGSKSSSHTDFVSAVGASTVVFTAGYRNRFHHPSAVVVQRYAAAGAARYRSDADGAICIKFAGGGIDIVRWRAQALRYWHDRSF